MSVEDFHRRTAKKWRKAIEEVGVVDQTTAVWTDLPSILRVLTPFMGRNLNHAHLPTGGGFDFHSVDLSAEDGCLEADTGDRSGHVFKPSRLTVENFPNNPEETFIYLQLDNMRPVISSGYYRGDGGMEEIVEVPGYGYQTREVWDQGYVGHDENGDEIPIPQNARLLVRWLAGSIMIVAKGSIWNGARETYAGIHNTMTPQAVRTQIEKVIARTV